MWADVGAYLIIYFFPLAFFFLFRLIFFSMLRINVAKPGSKICILSSCFAAALSEWVTCQNPSGSFPQKSAVCSVWKHEAAQFVFRVYSRLCFMVTLSWCPSSSHSVCQPSLHPHYDSHQLNYPQWIKKKNTSDLIWSNCRFLSLWLNNSQHPLTDLGLFGEKISRC